MKKIDLLDERSDYVKEVLETPPNSIITWGNTFFLGFMILILLLSWFIKYPDIVTSEIVLTTNTPPIFLASKTEGKIDTILKKNNQTINTDEWIAIVGSNANLDDILTLKKNIDTVTKLNYNIEDITKVNFPILNVGEIQSSYNSLVKSIEKFKHHERNGNFNIQQSLNKLQVHEYNNLLKGARRDKEISIKELEVVKKDLKRNKILLEKGVISQKDFENIELRHLQSIRTVEGKTSRISQLKSEKSSFKSTGNNLVFGEEQIQLNSELDILEAIKLTELAFIEWIKKHVLVSTVKGKISFLDFFSENQYVTNGKILVSVIPNHNNQDYFGVAKMPIVNSGKVKLNQKVNIKLLGYPEKEYGMVLGTIDNIADIPNDDKYLVKVKLNQGLKTTFNKEITFKQNIKGSAEIITDDLRLIERFIYTLTQAFQ